MDEWWQGVLSSLPAGWVHDPPLVRYNLPDPRLQAERAAYRKGGGSRQRLRSRDPLERGFYDLPHYQLRIHELLSLCPSDPLVVDLGCGDGRGVELLLKQGVRRVVAQDFNDEELKLLWTELGQEGEGKVLPVCASVTDPALMPGAAHALLMLEVACVLPDPGMAYESCHRWLRPGGYAIVSDPSPGAYFLHALLNADWEQVKRITERKVYADTVGGSPVEIHLFDGGAARRVAERVGFECLKSYELPGSVSLLRHALKMNRKLNSEAASLLAAAADSVLDVPGIHLSLLKKEAV